MSKKIIVGRRYAEAIFSIAESNKKVKEVYKALNEVMEIYLFNDNLKNILDNPLVDLDEKKKVMNKILEKNDINIKNIIFYILEKGRIQEIKEIVTQYLKIYYFKNKIIEVEAVFSHEISEKQKEKLIKNLEKRLKKKVNLKILIDESIIGGGMLKIGDKIIDGTVKNQLDLLLYKN